MLNRLTEETGSGTTVRIDRLKTVAANFSIEIPPPK